MLNEIYVGLFLSILLGALIGAQREMRQQKLRKKDFAGFRTFTFISILGYLVGYLSFDLQLNPYIFLITLIGLIVLISSSYFILNHGEYRLLGITTQIVAVLTFFIGTMISLKLYQISIALSIIITTMLVLGTKLHIFAKQIENAEVYATLKFAIISLIILPLLPNKNYSPLDFPLLGNFFDSQTYISKSFLLQLDVFNFYHIWLMVVFISGIAYIGYILMRTVGANKGILITGFLGGFMSSTALTSSFSIDSKKYKNYSLPLAIGVLVACSTMFFRILFEVMVINPMLIPGILISLGTMGLCGFLLAGYLVYDNKRHNNHLKKFETKSPFSLGPAFKFATIFFLVTFFSKLFSLIFGDSGIYILSFISGISDVDAITISLSTLSLAGSISSKVATFGIILAAMSNTIFKGLIALYLGSNKFSQKIIYSFSVILLIGGISLIL